MNDRWRFLLNRIGEHLWIRPLVVCMASIGLALLARMADGTSASDYLPDVTKDSVELLLNILSASMLVIATFAVGSMVAAYSSASNRATPRSFPLVIADDVSQNALSTFVGAFIFSIIAHIAIKNGYFGPAGRFVLFALTLILFATVIVTFLRWVDSIARLGRLGATIRMVEASAQDALQRRRVAPRMGGVPVGRSASTDVPVYVDVIGYVQQVDIAAIQTVAEAKGLRLRLAALPGTFVAPGRALVFVVDGVDRLSDAVADELRATFTIGRDRTFDEDPRFGLVVLSEIACRALSPAVNDPGTAIDVVGSLVRLLADWCTPPSDHDGDASEPLFSRVEVAELSMNDMFDDAFRAIARDGAGIIEVVVRLQKALQALTAICDENVREVALRQALSARARAEATLTASEDLTLLHHVSHFADEAS